MRIISGEFRGRTLKAPKGQDTRPTTDRVREAMMSSVCSARGSFEGAMVLDAFAGSGALGLEALSRGAACVHFCERSANALRVLQENVCALALDGRRVRVRKIDVLKDLPVYARVSFDLVFLDPPYALEVDSVFGLIDALCGRSAISNGSLVVYEHAASSSEMVHAAIGERDWTLAQHKRYGDTVVDIIRIEGAATV